MMISKLAFAAGLFVASSLGGVALGSYTIGGFRIDNRPDIIGDLAAVDVSSSVPQQPVAIPIADYAHVCKGCDAKLYRDEAWRYDEPVQEESGGEDYGEPEDLMTQDDATPPSTEDHADAPVVQVADSMPTVPASQAPTQVALVRNF